MFAINLFQQKNKFLIEIMKLNDEIAQKCSILNS